MISVDSLRSIKSEVGTGDEVTRILIIGLPGAGKTTLLNRISLSQGEKKIHDMGNQKFKVRNLVVEGLNLTVWDIGENVYVDPYWADYHAERVQGVCFVVDSANAALFPEARKELFAALGMEKLARVPLLIFANKGDLENSASVVKTSEALELHEIKHRDYKVFRSSGVTDEGIQQGLEWMVSQKFTR
jgi:small GTP-binding protein